MYIYTRHIYIYNIQERNVRCLAQNIVSKSQICRETNQLQLVHHKHLNVTRAWYYEPVSLIRVSRGREHYI